MDTLAGRPNRWFRRYRPRQTALCRLIWFPHAGGSASFYRAWADDFPPDIELLVVQYPGREERISEPAIDDMAVLTAHVARALEPELDRPVALFGHSMGASVAFEVAAALERRHPLSVRRLFVSARPAPSCDAGGVVHLADDEGLLDHVDALGGTDSGLLREPELRRLILPVLRNDYRLIETYRPDHRQVLDAPVVAFAGDRDPQVTPDQLRRWRESTRGDFRMHVFTGDHFYLTHRRPAVIAEIVKELREGVPR